MLLLTVLLTKNKVCPACNDRLPADESFLHRSIASAPAHLHPVVYALLHVRAEVAMLSDFPEDEIWNRPSGGVSVGFHLQHHYGEVN